MNKIDDILYDAKLEKLKWELKNYFSGWLLIILITKILLFRNVDLNLFNRVYNKY